MKSNKLLKTAFTLVELLVVIAIIGILSGLIIVGMNSSVQSATIAKAQIFSASLRDSLLNNLISDWKLDDASGTNAADGWGTNNCTWNGSAGGSNTSPNWRPSSECVHGGCLNFDGTDDYLNCGNTTSLNITNNLTVEAWIKLQSTGSFQSVIDKAWSDGYAILVHNGRMVIGYYSGGGSPNFYTVSTATGIFDWNVWTHIAYTYSTSNTKLYINGIERASKTPEGNITLNASSVRIGGVGTYYSKGNIDNLRIYSATISASQIKEQYYAGIKNLLIKKQISLEDYKNRLKELRLAEK